MKREYSDFFGNIEKAKKRTVVKEGLGYNKTLFLQIRKTLPKNLNLRGFKNTAGVGFGSNRVLVTPICEYELYAENKTAALLLKGYCSAKKEAVSVVCDVLKKLGYELAEPDFNDDELVFRPLREEDIYEDANNEVRYFRPNGRKIDGIKDEEATILAALYGWIVFPEDSDEDETEESDEDAKVKPVEDTTGNKEEQQPEDKTREQSGDTKEKPVKDTKEEPLEAVTADTSETPPGDKTDSRQGGIESEEDEIEQRIAELKNEFLESSETLIKIYEDLISGKIPDNYKEVEKINSLREEFDSLIEELNIKNPEKINTIQDIQEEYKKIKDEKSKEIFIKVLDVLNRYRKIYHVKGEDFAFFKELNSISETYENLIEENKVHKEDEWFTKLNEDRHLFNHLNKAVEIRQTEKYDDQELDEVLDHLEEECDANNFNFYKKLSNQINRGKLAFREDDQPKPPKKKKPGSQKKEGEVLITKTEDELEDEQVSDEMTSGTDEKGDRVETEVVDLEINDKGEEEIPEVDKKEEDELIDETKETKETKKELPAPEKSPEVIVETTITKKKALPDEDKNILELLKRDEPELAYYLALCYEKQDKKLLTPSWLLQNLFLSLKMRSSYAPVAEKVNANLEHYNFKYSKTEECELLNNLVFSSILRPSLLAYNSGAGIILDSVHSGRISQFNTIKKLISDFMNLSGGVLNFESLTHISDQEELNKSRDNFKGELSAWLERSRNIKYRNNKGHFYTIAFNGWVKKGGWLSNAVEKIISSDKLKLINDLLKVDLDEDTWKKRFAKDLKSVIDKKQFRYGNTDADRWFKTQTDSLKELLSEGLGFYSEVDPNEQTFIYQQSSLTDFVKQVLTELNLIKQTFTEAESESEYYKISRLYLTKAVDNIIGILTSKQQVGKPLEVSEIQNKSLLKLSSYSSLTDWSPAQYDAGLASAIQKYLIEPKQSTNEIAKKHIESGNYEAFNRMSSIYGLEEELISNVPDERIFEQRVGHEIQKVGIEIEKGCAYGYISNNKRSDLIAELEPIANFHQSNVDGVNFPLRETQLDQILRKVQTEKLNAIENYQRQIPENIGPKKQAILSKYLANGNILAFIETLDRIESDEYVEIEYESSDFNGFYDDFLVNNDPINISEFKKAAEQNKSYSEINFKSYSENQKAELLDVFLRWFSLKEIWDFKVEDSQASIKILLEYVGFNSVIIERVEKYRKSFFIDFKCNPISGRNRTPIPQFGSIANGEYRLMCSSKRLSEDDLVDDIIQLTPDTQRALIVFHFDWLKQKSRLEIARLSKSKRAIFLLLDEATLTYLAGTKKNKFATFVKLAAPLCYAKPYQTASSNLPEEMFYGRGPQIQKLKNISGDYSCLIYGGRQLGKTVLQQEVKRLFEDPQNHHYSFYIDLRNSGIGLWNPIEKLSSVIYEALKSIPGLFPSKEPSNFGMPFLRSKILDWFNNNKAARIILFLDEADKFLEQDSQKEWPHIHPLKGIMDDTKNRFKVILAGLHDVRRTIKIPNNPLAHLGTPICVGSMNEKSETTEALQLIKLPLETLGYKFESEDLVYVILSHCNWYPSLIQIFCNKLIDTLYSKRRIQKLPIPITDKDVSLAYFGCKEQIREKFKLTLNLDERYDLLANLIANETIEQPDYQSKGISVNYITELANVAWQKGFDSINPKIDVNNLLEEMVDLGVLRLVSPGKFAIRTPNLIGLIGSEKEIADNMNKVRELPQEFRREQSRIIYEKDGVELRSPFPASYYDRFFTTESKIIVFRGSKMGGILKIEEFMESRKKELNFIIPPFTSINLENINHFWTEVDKKRTPGKPDVVFFNIDDSYSIEEISLINETLGKRESLTIVFAVGPQRIWEFLGENDNSFEKLENQKVQVINLPQWRKDIAKEWIKVVCQTANISTVFDKISNWHTLLYNYQQKIANSPEKWEKILSEYESSILNPSKDTIEDFGLISETIVSSLKELIVLDGSSSKQEFIEYLGIETGMDKAKNIVEYLLWLNLVDGELKVNPVIQKILSNG